MPGYPCHHSLGRYFKSYTRTRFRATLAALITLFLFIVTFRSASLPSISFLYPNHGKALEACNDIIASARSYLDAPLPTSAFGEMGNRTKIITDWMEEAAHLSQYLSRKETALLTAQLEETVVSMYPFLKNPMDPENPLPFATLRKSIIPGSRGIVITSGRSHFRYALHLIGNIRIVLKSNLPIQIMYAGEDDLPSDHRKVLTSMFRHVKTLDLLTVFDDTAIDLRHGTWATKSFAVLASKFEQVLAVDADAVFLQKPDVIFENHSGYRSRGVLLFHDRLLWQNMFIERAEWWKKEMGNRIPSDTLTSSKVWTEGYAEECDSGVIALDKSRLAVLMALLHICWQNSADVRTQWTYRLTYGDKESWWFGLELCSVPFVFENHYAAVLGRTEIRNEQTLVCSFSIAHVDEQEKLLWYNGSLLKNKAFNLTDFIVPEVWMVDGFWIKGNTKADTSCMRDSEVRDVQEDIKKVINDSITVAQWVDKEVQHLGINVVSDSDMHL